MLSCVFCGTPFFIEHLQWLLPNYYSIVQYLRVEALVLNVLVLLSDQYRRATGGGGLPLLFWKLKKDAIIFRKKCSDCFRPRVKFLI